MKYVILVLALLVSAHSLCMDPLDSVHPITSKGEIIGYVSYRVLECYPERRLWIVFDAHQNRLGTVSTTSKSDKPSWLEEFSLARYIKNKVTNGK